MKSVWHLVVFLAAGQVVLGQRPNNTVICDYYAEQRYGGNNGTTQFQLMQDIVALAFGGGAGVKNAWSNMTGNFNPGTYMGTPVDLITWFDGSKPSSNVNGNPEAVNWLDAGGVDPLHSFLNGSTSNVTVKDGSNESNLFLHFYISFGYLFSCSEVKAFPKGNVSPSAGGSSEPLSVAYVHKFMNLNQTDLGYFISQITMAAQYFGFSPEDAGQMQTQMTATYNVRCAAPENGQLNSLCLAPECPLALNPDCSAYNNLGPYGVNDTTPSQTADAGGPSTVTQTVGATASTDAAASASPPALSAGGIAGVVIGALAALFLAGIALLLVRRHKRAAGPTASSPAAAAAAGGHGPPADQPDMKGAGMVAGSTHAAFPPSSPYSSHASFVSPHGSMHLHHNPPYSPSGGAPTTDGYSTPKPPYSTPHSPAPAHYYQHQPPAELGGTGTGTGTGAAPMGPIAEMPDSNPYGQQHAGPGTATGFGAGREGDGGLMNYRDSGTPSSGVFRASSPVPSPSPARSPVDFGYGGWHGPIQ